MVHNGLWKGIALTIILDYFEHTVITKVKVPIITNKTLLSRYFRKGVLFLNIGVHSLSDIGSGKYIKALWPNMTFYARRCDACIMKNLAHYLVKTVLPRLLSSRQIEPIKWQDPFNKAIGWGSWVTFANSLLYCATLYCTVQLLTVLRNSLLYGATHYCIVQLLTVLCNSLLYCATPYCIAQLFTVWCNSLLYCATPYGIVQLLAVLCSSLLYCATL